MNEEKYFPGNNYIKNDCIIVLKHSGKKVSRETKKYNERRK